MDTLEKYGKKRNFIFLQSPIGPFFSLLAKELKSLGHNVSKINFWGGDIVFYPDGIPYKDTIENWGKFFTNHCIKNKITDIVLFGDRRPYHERAIESIAQINSDTNIWVFEEGYFRPHWVTLDKYGANNRSSIDLSNIEYNSDNILTHTQNPIPINPWLKEAIPSILQYYFFGLISKFTGFNNFKYHRLKHPLFEMSNWIIKWGASALKLKDDELLILQARPKLTNHFVLALQLETDSQIRMYSPFKTMKEIMETSMISFKNHAPPNTNLIVKSHPFDEKWKQREAEFKKIAKELDIENRVAFIDNCNVSTFLDNSLGLITANSTLSLFALENNIPVIALGQAFWNVEEITNKKELSAFWSNPEKPNPILFINMKNKIMETQINGNFYSKEGRDILLKGAVNHILNEKQDTKYLTDKVLKRIKENNKSRLNHRVSYIPKKLDLKV